MMKSLVVIPSRMGSSRFPGKPLCKIAGKEMILHVCDRVAEGFDLVVATPDDEIKRVVKQAGYNVIMTDKNCPTGTDRVAEVSKSIKAEIYINVQGDEPLILIKDIKNVLNCKEICYNKVVGSMTELLENNINVVKVFQCLNRLRVLTRKGNAFYRQCGLYAFNKEELDLYYNIPYQEKIKSLERNENIELMRFVELDYPVHMQIITGSPSVDIPEDIEKILEVISNGRAES